MLDDLKKIHERDPQDALGIAEKQGNQLDLEFTVPTITGIENVVLAGMGGSALSALVAKSWLNLSIPFEVVREYTIPAYIKTGTLFIASSYSGNTEETVSALQLAADTGATIVVIAAGGKLQEIAEQQSYPFLKLPAGYQPRHVVLASLKAVVDVFEAAGLVDGKTAELAAANETVTNYIKAWVPTVPTSNNQAKQLALELMGKSVVMYAGPILSAAAYKWKISMNENAKHIAWWNQFSEFNHNEFIGWTKQPEDKPYAVIQLQSKLEHPRIQKRFEISNTLLSGLWPSPLIVHAEGETMLDQLLYTIALGDFVSLYLAILGNINPTPVELIEKLKLALNG